MTRLKATTAPATRSLHTYSGAYHVDYHLPLPLRAHGHEVARHVSDHRLCQRAQRLERRRYLTFAAAASSVLVNKSHNRTIRRRNTCPDPVDDMEDELLEKGHRVWGFTVYRCTYGGDAA
jgi:hypothetical protein